MAAKHGIGQGDERFDPAGVGAGTIFHATKDVEGVTTAASIWTTTVIGLAADAGLYKIVVLRMILALFVLAIVWMVERGFAARP